MTRIIFTLIALSGLASALPSSTSTVASAAATKAPIVNNTAVNTAAALIPELLPLVESPATDTSVASTPTITTPAPSTTPSAQSTSRAARPAPATTATRSGGANINTAASRLLGIRYMLGGTGKGGIDCSAFTMRVFQQLGIKLPRTAAQQYRTGVPVNSRDLRPGDLVFFNTNGRVASHVGIYLGNGMMANANSYHGKSMVEPLFSNPYWANRYIGARRVMS